MKKFILVSLFVVLLGIASAVDIATGCTDANANITSQGSYNLLVAATGSPNVITSAGFGAINTCIYINSSDVDFSCGGYAIVNDATPDPTAAILVDGSNGVLTNVTIRDCPSIANYSYGVAVYLANNTLITNNTFTNNTIAGVDLFDSNASNVTNLNIYDVPVDASGIFIEPGSFNILSNISISGLNDSNSFGIRLSGVNFTNVSSINASNLETGFRLGSSNENILSDNFAFNNTQYGFSITSSSNLNNLSTNYALNNTDDGFHLDDSTQNNLWNNNASENGINGFYLYYSASGSSNNTLWNNIANNNSANGFSIYGSENNSLYDNLAYNNTNNGFRVQSSNYTNLTNNIANNNTQNGYSIETTTNVTLSLNNATGNTDEGFYALDSDQLTFDFNNAFDSLGNGFYLSNTNNSILTNNTANNSFASGFYITDSSIYDTLTQNNATYSLFYGFDIRLSSYINILLSYVSYNTVNGISFYNNVANSSIQNNTVLNSGLNGIHLQGAGVNNIVAYNNVSNSSQLLTTGAINIFNSESATLGGNYLFDNPVNGLSIMNSNVTSTSNIFENNSLDILINNTAIFNNYTIYMVYHILDNPNGGLANYSNISIIDSLTPGSEYSISWATNSSPLSSGYASFENKYFNLTNYTSGFTIDEFGIHWLDSELTGYTESRFTFGLDNGSSWSIPTSYLTAGSNTLALQDYLGSGILGVLQGPPAATPTPSSGSSRSTPTLSVALSSSCNNNTITTNVGTASVNVLDENTGAAVYSGTSDSDGIAKFNSCGRIVRVYANKDGYRSTDSVFTLNSCSCLTPAVVPPVVVPPTPPVTTTPPVVTPPVVTPTNTTTPPAPPVVVPTTPVVPTFTGPTTGRVGESSTFEVGSCSDCTVRVESPDGRTTTLTPTSGRVSLPLTLAGTYRLSLLRSGEVVKSLSVSATAPVPTVAPAVPAGASDNGMGFALMILVLLVIVGGVAYYLMSRKK